MLKSRLLVAVATLLTFATGLALINVAHAQERTMTLQAVEGSGVGGEVSLTADGDNVQVSVSATGLTSGESYLSGAYDTTSVGCMGGIIGSFASPAEATSDTMTIEYSVPGPIDDIFSVSVREGAEPPGSVVACAEDTEAAAPADEPEAQPAEEADAVTMAPPTTGSGGLLAATEQRAVFLLAAGGIAAIAVLAVTVRLARGSR